MVEVVVEIVNHTKLCQIGDCTDVCFERILDLTEDRAEYRVSHLTPSEQRCAEAVSNNTFIGAIHRRGRTRCFIAVHKILKDVFNSRAICAAVDTNTRGDSGFGQWTYKPCVQTLGNVRVVDVKLFCVLERLLKLFRIEPVRILEGGIFAPHVCAKFIVDDVLNVREQPGLNERRVSYLS